MSASPHPRPWSGLVREPVGADARHAGTSVHVRVLGQGPLVVIATGLGMSARAFARLVTMLRVDHTVVTFDRPGLGRLSGLPRRHPPTLLAEVDRLRVAIESAHRLGTQGRAVVVGHSMAGFFVEALARHHPQLSAGVVMLDGSLEPPAPVSPARIHFPLRLGRALNAISGSAGLLRWVGSMLIEDAGYPSMPSQLEGVRAQAPLPDIPVNVLVAVLHPFSPRAQTWIGRQRTLAARLAADHPRGADGVRLVVVERSGHHIAHWQAGQVADAIRAITGVQPPE